ncbi:MAG: C-GCAxxG-C-C family protein [Oscillospiraceae bacterium]|nr:C-GCAxxG-C-C family protein [Oscillospiraceae bacterium]
MKKEVNIKQVRYDAEEVFRIGGFYCSEAIVSSIRMNFDPSMPKELIKSASGFPIGVGRSKCMCGAISGAIIALGYFFGRGAQSADADDTKGNKCMELSYELQDSFRKNHQGTLCCHIHVEGMDLLNAEHKKQCVAFTGEMAVKTAEIIARELNMKLLYDDVEVR